MGISARLVRRSYSAARGNRALRTLVTISRHWAVDARDAFIVSYPRSGNTWLKFVLVHLLTGKAADLTDHESIVPYVGSHRKAPHVLPSGGRLLKSHEPYRRDYGSAYQRGAYIVRDGRDVAVSYYYYQ